MHDESTNRLSANASTNAVLDLDALRREGHVLLRAAIPAEWIEALRGAFDAGIRGSNEWPVPRGVDIRHSCLDLDPRVQGTCRLPTLLTAVGALIGERFFIAQAEGREPLAGGGQQRLHRDLCANRPGDTVNALVFLDAFGPSNGGTRIVPASHRPSPGSSDDFDDESRTVQLTGSAGDVFVFDADLVHGGCVNRSGARRRSILIGYFAETMRASHRRTAALRAVRMDTSEFFDP